MSVERDVVITLKMRTDASAASQAAQFRQLTQSAYQGAEKATSSWDRAIAKAHMRADASLKAHTARMKEAEKAEAARQRAADRASAAQQRAAEKISAANAKVVTSGREALEGVLKLGRGLAILSITGEENLALFARYFVQVQAGFDVLSGGIKIVLSLRDAYRAMAAAQAAATVAGGLASGVGGGAAGRAGAGLLATGATGAAGAAAAANGGRLASLAGRALPFLSAAGRVAGVAGIGASAWQAGRRALGDKSANAEDPFVAIGSTLKTVFIDLAKSASAVKSAEEKRLVVIEAVQRAELERAQLMGQLQAGRENYAARRDRAQGLDDAAAAQASRLRLGSALEQEEARLRDARKDNPEAVLQHHQNILSIKEQIAAADESAAEAAKRTKEELTQQLASAQQLLRASQERVRAEEAGAKSGLARFGEMSPQQQQALRGISEKVQRGGAINQLEADLLKQSGFGGSLAEGFYANKGKAAGGEGVLRGLGEMDALDQARQAEADAAAQVARLKGEEQVATQRATEATNRLVETLDRAATAFEELARLQQEQINRQRDQTINPPDPRQSLPQQQPDPSVFSQMFWAVRGQDARQMQGAMQAME